MKPRRTVICYHAVATCPPEDDPNLLFVDERAFEAQMRFLARRRDVVPLEAIVNDELPGNRPAVAITFDDGYRSVLTTAAPILARYGFAATVFVPTKWVGSANAWDEPGDSRCDLSVMTPHELREAEAEGLAIESHGHAHVPLDGDGDAAARDVAASRDRLAEMLGRRPRYLAYPFGRYSPQLLRTAEAAGFDAAFTVNPFAPAGRYALGRAAIWGGDSPLAFALKTSGRYLAWRRSRLPRLAHAMLRPLLRRR